MADMPGDFKLLMGDGMREPLQRHEVDYAEKTLGVFVSMDGNENAEKRYLRDQSVTFADQMKTSKANKNDYMYTYTASFMKTMEYPMAVTQLSEAEWNHIVAPALQNSLQKGGMSKNSPELSSMALTTTRDSMLCIPTSIRRSPISPLMYKKV